MKNWLKFSYKSLRETVLFLQGKRKAKEEQMLFWMQYCSFPDAMRDIEQLFRQNKHLKLHRYKAFRAWYKYHKDWEKKDLEFYAKLLANGMTTHEEDPYYDPNAPDWAQFDRPHYYDDDDADEDYDDYDGDDEDYDDYDEDDFDEKSPDFKKAARDGFMMGIGYGIVNNTLSN